MYYIVSALFYLIPAAALIFFVVSLIRYLHAKKKNKQTPDSFSPDQIKSRKLCLAVSSVIAGILAVVVLAFVVLIMMAIAFM